MTRDWFADLNDRVSKGLRAPLGPQHEELRKAVGRIIDPQAFTTTLPASSYNALRKADAIIALVAAAVSSQLRQSQGE